VIDGKISGMRATIGNMAVLIPALSILLGILSISGAAATDSLSPRERC